MVTPLRVYRHAAEVLNEGAYHNFSGSTAASLAKLENSQPGDMTVLDSGFIIRGKFDPGPINDEIRFTDPTTGYWKSAFITPSSSSGVAESYDGAELATELQNQMNAICSPGSFSHSYDTNGDNTFRLSSSLGPFSIDWDYNVATRGLAGTMGYDIGLVSGQPAYKADSNVYCEDQHWIVWDMELSRVGTPLVCFMVYCPTLDVGDTIQLFGIRDDQYQGPDRKQYINGAAEYVGEQHTSTKHGANEIFVWQPVDRDGVSGVNVRYWLVAIERKAAATATSNTKIGCVAAWDAAAYEGDRNYRSPYIVDPVIPDRTTYPDGGGAGYRFQQRAYYTADLDFMRFGATTYNAFEEMFHKFGKFEGLWLLNPDEHKQNEMLFCHPDLQVTEKDGPGRVVSFRCALRQIPMNPREP